MSDGGKEGEAKEERREDKKEKGQGGIKGRR